MIMFFESLSFLKTQISCVIGKMGAKMMSHDNFPKFYHMKNSLIPLNFTISISEILEIIKVSQLK